MTLDPKALEAAWDAYVNSSMDTAHFTIDAVSAAITAYLAATKATAHDPAPVSGWRPMASAPRDGTLFLAAWQPMPAPARTFEDDALLELIDAPPSSARAERGE